MAKRRCIMVVIDLDVIVKHHHEVFAGIQRYATEQGWVCRVWPHVGDDLKRRRGIQGYDGLIGRLTPELANLARRRRIPAVNVWHNSTASSVPLVGVDYHAAGALAAGHLMDRGFIRIGYLGHSRVKTSAQFAAGLRTAANLGAGDLTQLLVPASYSRSAETWRSFRAQMDKWASTWRPPLGIIAAQDSLARYVVNTALAMGLRVPEDVAVIGSSNETVVCLRPEPAITSIEFGLERVGYRAGALLDELLRGCRAPKKPILLPPVGLVIRESSDAFAVDDPLVAQALRYMADQCERPIQVQDVVDHVPASWRNLERLFQKVRGRTINDELTRLRLERVKRLLAETEMEIKRITFRCGFKSPHQLCRVFRRAEGQSPGEFRRSCKSTLGSAPAN